MHNPATHHEHAIAKQTKQSKQEANKKSKQKATKQSKQKQSSKANNNQAKQMRSKQNSATKKQPSKANNSNQMSPPHTDFVQAVRTRRVSKNEGVPGHVSATMTSCEGLNDRKPPKEAS
jgi:DNA anti-recombination protein RmuC